MKKLLLVSFLALGMISGCNNAAAPPQLTVTMPSASSLAGGPGSSFSLQLQAGGGTPPFTWSLVTGAVATRLSINARAGQVSAALDPAGLPPGLTLSSTGLISGTVSSSAAPGTYSFTVKVTDSSSPPQSAQLALSITVPPPLTITTTSPLPDGIVMTAYSQTLQSSGGFPPVTWSVTSGTLPAGLSLNASTGVISGTPTTAATSSFTVKVVDSAKGQQSVQKPLSIKINPAQLTITTTSPLPPGTVNSAYSQTLQSSGGTSPVAWSITTGTLPQGLTLNGTSGVISGTPTAAGDFTFTARAADSSTPQQTATKPLMVTIRPALSITTTSLPDGSVMTAYSATLLSSGGTPPVTWSVTSGTLPVGLTLNTSTGVISGTPTTAGTSSFTVKVTDTSNPVQMDTKPLSIKITPAPLTISTTSLPNGTVGAAYGPGGAGATLTATGGMTPFTWSWAAATGSSLPPGLMISTNAGNNTGLIAGMPTTAGTFNVVVTVKDSESPAMMDSRNFSITINVASTCTPSGTTLCGQFDFLAQGQLGSGDTPIMIAGTFTANGTGGIIAGVLDLNSATLQLSNVPITPGPPTTWQVGSDGRGTITLGTSTPIGPIQFTFALNSTGTFAFLFDSDDTTGTGPHQSGYMRAADKTKFNAASIIGGYALGFVGGNSAAMRSRAAMLAAVSASGSGCGLASNGNSVLILHDRGMFNPTPISFTCGTGGLATIDAMTGRGTVSIVLVGGPFTPQTLNFAFYVTDANNVIFISTDSPSATFAILSGTMFKQAKTSFSLSDLACGFAPDTNKGCVFLVSGESGAGGLGASHIAAGRAVGTATGVLTLTIDDNKAGTFTSRTEVGWTANLLSPTNGLGTLTPPTGAQSAPAGFVLIDTDTAIVGAVDGSEQVGFIKPQTATTLSSSPGTFIIGTQLVAHGREPNVSGIITPTGPSPAGSGTLTGTIDVEQILVPPPAPVEFRGAPIMGTYMLDSTTGRGTGSSTSPGPSLFIIWIIGPNEIVLLESDTGPTGSPDPVLIDMMKQ